MEKIELNQIFTETIFKYLQNKDNIILEDKYEASNTDYKTSKDLERQKKIQQIFSNSNKGKLSEKGINKLTKQIEDNNLNYENMPEWVLQTYMDSSKHGAIPLKNNLWLDVDSLVGEDGELGVGYITYSGVVVNDARTNVGGIISINILRSPHVDVEKWGKIITFEKASIKALQIIDRKKKMMGQTGINNMNPADEGQSQTNTQNATGSGGGGLNVPENSGNVGSDGNGGGTIPGETSEQGAGTASVPNAPTNNLGGVPVDKNGSPDLSGENEEGNEESEKTK